MLLTINQQTYRLKRVPGNFILQQRTPKHWKSVAWYGTIPQLAYGLARIAGELEPVDSDDLTTAARDLLQRFDEAVIDLSYQLQRADCIV